MRYQIYEAKSVKYDAQQRVGVILRQQNPPVLAPYGAAPGGFFTFYQCRVNCSK